MELVPIVFGIIMGLALFLYGMMMLGSGLREAAGERPGHWIEKPTNNGIKREGVGADAGIVFAGAFRNIERISGHARNSSMATIQGF